MKKKSTRLTLAFLVTLSVLGAVLAPMVALADESAGAVESSAVEPAAESAPVEPAAESAPVEPAAESAPAEPAPVEVESSSTSAVTTKVTSPTRESFRSESNALQVSSDQVETFQEDNDCRGGVNADEFALVLVGTQSSGGNTTFTWRLDYVGTKEDCATSELNVSHVTITTCLAAISGTYKEASGTTYKWEGNPSAGATFSLTFAGTVADTGTASTSIKKRDDDPVGGSVAGPGCGTSSDCPTGYTLDITTVGSGSVTGADDNSSHDEDDTVTLTATAATGWTFTGWSGDGTTNQNGTHTITFSGSTCTKSVTATFTENSVEDCPDGYTLDIKTVGSGSVTGAADDSTHAENDTATLTATAASGWSFSGWSGDGTTNQNSTRTITFSGSTCTKSVTATFTEDTVVVDCPTGYSLDISVVGSGAVTGAEDDSTHVAGTTANLTATAATGWSFTGWSGDGITNGDSTRSISFSGADCSKAVTANFTEDVVPVDCPDGYTLGIEVAGQGSVTGATDGSVHAAGTSVTLTAVPDEGHEFVAWSGAGITNGDDSRSVTFSGPDCEPEVAAEFDAEEVVLPRIIDRDPGKPDGPKVLGNVEPPAVKGAVLPFTGPSLLPMMLLALLLIGAGVSVSRRARTES